MSAAIRSHMEPYVQAHWVYRCMECGRKDYFTRPLEKAPREYRMTAWCHADAIEPWPAVMEWAYEAVCWMASGGWEGGETEFDVLIGFDLDQWVKVGPLDMLRDVPGVEDMRTRPVRKHLKKALELARKWGDKRITEAQPAPVLHFSAWMED